MIVLVFMVTLGRHLALEKDFVMLENPKPGRNIKLKRMGKLFCSVIPFNYLWGVNHFVLLFHSVVFPFSTRNMHE